MAEAIEAKSLSQINDRANQPPRFFEVPPGYQKWDPLVLYISRVVGSNVVILSPVIPNERIVSAEDVKSALYLVHLDNPVPAPVRGEAACRSSQDTRRLPQSIIPRRPVGGSDRPLTPESSPSASQSHQPSAIEAPGRTLYGLHTAMPPKKPVGSQSSPRTSTETSASAQIVSKDSSGPQEPSGNTQTHCINSIPVPRPDTSLPPTNSGNQSSLSNSQPISQAHSRSPSPRKHSTASTDMPLTLTLTRQNPAAQKWTVGYIRLHELESSSGDGDTASTSTTSPKQHPPIDIDIIQSGYTEFREHCVRKYSPTESGDLKAAAGSTARGSMDHQSSMYGNNAVFHRRVAMNYSNSLLTNAKEFARNLTRNRSDSAASVSSYKSDTAVKPDTICTFGSPPEGMKARGYTFVSPWEGQCHFSTGKHGNSLQCFHIPAPPPATATVYSNSLVKTSHSESTLISTLSYNLALSPVQAKGPTGVLGKFIDCCSKPRKSNIPSDSRYESSFTSLGAERAGGGLNGREAKLATLTIYDDGLKMLDLVVAANIGVFWRTWEKFAPASTEQKHVSEAQIPFPSIEDDC
ncbi:hypothetical protein MGU_10683 [Metarhizium guizhouense ARSEF 977]|uniref:Oxidoreductase-like protein n=1 Tax=Metarhizium guizhouense (strain ARSEF 977) TaxID=1276136 RepID=A0A0B4GHP7_METGA|nr:hypothetical protein MGU_10683 [Metarhizium guizhouense ARSEF 977]